MAEDKPQNLDSSSATPPFEEEEWDSTSITPGVVFSLLSEKRKRQVLYLLFVSEDSLTFDELAERIASVKSSSAPEVESEDVKERIRSHLYHADLPKLANRGFVEYDEEAETVTLTRQAEVIRPVLQYARRLEDDVDGLLEAPSE